MKKLLISAAATVALVTGLVLGLHSMSDIDPILEANIEALTSGEGGLYITGRTEGLIVPEAEMKLVNHYSMFDKWITGFPVILCMALPLSCSDSGMPLTDAPHEEICVLETDGSCGMLGRLNSLAVIDSDCFAICDEMQVYLYNMQGKQIRCIGRSGNAGYEYNMPTVVRTDGNDIYVWSSMTLKFLAYDLQGKVTGEYGYSSAVRDFIPCGDNIAVYTNGVRDDMMIDIYSKSDKEIQGCFWNTTERMRRNIDGFF